MQPDMKRYMLTAPSRWETLGSVIETLLSEVSHINTGKLDPVYVVKGKRHQNDRTGRCCSGAQLNTVHYCLLWLQRRKLN